ncbi:MAG: lipid-binding SYLF domain-containing protein [Chlorobiaceae bacterium]|nr:lipid-binding SYLF domain-containing protein [Chlorobiaceae bacterium]
MMRMMKIFMLGLMLAGLVAAKAEAGWDPADVHKAENSVVFFKKYHTLDRFFENAYGYVVFPNVYKGGLMLFGGGHGKGYVYEQGVLVGHSSITQVNFGPQLGGQSFAEIIFFKDKGALDTFKKGNYELSAQATAIVVKSGMATNTDYSNGVAVFVKPKSGLMAELTVGGQKFTYKAY